MKIIVSGASGFLGRQFVRDAISSGHDVFPLLRRRPAVKPSGEKLGVRAWYLEDLDFSASRFRHQFLESADAWVDLAWQGVPGAARNNRFQFDNLGLVSRLSELALRMKVKHFIGAGSQAEYGPANERIDESAPLRPTSLYGAAKVASFRLLEERFNGSATAFSWARIFSIYGPEQSSDWLFPSIAKSIAAGLPVRLTKCEQTWDYLHVSDASLALLRIAEGRNGIGAVNVASSNEMLLRDMVSHLCMLMDPRIEPHFGAIAYRDDQVMTMMADTTKLRSTGWRPTVDFLRGINECASIWKDAGVRE